MTNRAFPALLSAALVFACSNAERPSPAPAPSTSSSTDHPLTGPETDCASCHPQQVEEWKVSSHAYAMKDPVFHAMVRLGQKETQGALGDFCVKCHSPIGNMMGQTVVEQDASGVFTQRTTGLDTAAMDGVSCLVCHGATKVQTVANAGFEFSLDGVVRGPISDPAKSPVHSSTFSGLFEDTKLCGTCHVVVNPKNVPLEQTHVEWVQSIFNGSKSCQDCHMPETTGPAAVGHGDRPLHDHRFVGVDVSLLPPDEFPGYDDFRTRVQDLLKDTTNFSARGDAATKRLLVDIENRAGHSLPSGATADREVWVELTVKDAAGQTVLESGTLDERGDLRVAFPERTTRPGTDPQLILFTQEMRFDPTPSDAGIPGDAHLVDFLWQPNRETSHLIRAGEIAHRFYDLSALAPGDYTVNTRLLFRAFAPHLLRRLEAEAGLDPAVAPRATTVEMATAALTISLTAP